MNSILNFSSYNELIRIHNLMAKDAPMQEIIDAVKFYWAIAIDIKGDEARYHDARLNPTTIDALYDYK